MASRVALELSTVRDRTRVVNQLNRLLDLSLEVPAAGSELCAGLLAAIDADTAHDSSATHRLIEALSADHTVSGFIADLAEILLLARHDRSEYVFNSQLSPPFVIRKLLLEYAIKSLELDTLTSALTKSFCATTCDRLPVGCCSVLGYDLGLVPDFMLELQRIEAERNGWQPPKREQACRYHSPAGCCIALFKSPACVGYLCNALDAQMAERFPTAELSEFRDELAHFRNCDIDRARVFETMDRVVAAGQRLLASV